MKKAVLGRLVSLICALSLLAAPAGAAQEKVPGPDIPADVEEHLRQTDPYADFSSDRSTWFFSVDGGKMVFCDFFSPFDPFTKVRTYDPLILYRLDNAYTAERDEDGSRVLMMDLNDLEKLYDPYFAWKYVPSTGNQNSGTLYLRYTLYNKLEIDGFGARSTKLLYYKSVWDVILTVKDGIADAGTWYCTTYDPALGGRNLSDFKIDKKTAQLKTGVVQLSHSAQYSDGAWSVPAGELMEYMGKACFEEAGYIHIQTEGLVDVTAEMTLAERMVQAEKSAYSYSGTVDEQSIQIPAVVIPRASNQWHSGCYEKTTDYTWANYMDDVADGTRTSGWLWRAFYLSSNDTYRDTNGTDVTDAVADRIVPFNLYVPTCYSQEETRLTYMLHGGTGNENTATYRLMIREGNVTEVDSLAEAYNYIIVSPNGWTQNPMWREMQALNSFLAAKEMVTEEFPVDPNKVFITGNSMGGKGTFEIAMRMPELFRAIAPTAAKIAEQTKNADGTTKNVCNIEDSTVYSLKKDLADMPVMMVQGNVDTTTSFKVQLGSPTFEGMISNHVMPYLHNATYITVESGSHPHAYGAALPAIFDFFETQLSPDQETYSFDVLGASERAGSLVYLDGEPYELTVPTKIVNGTIMMALSELEELYGTDFRSYYVENYNEDPVKIRKYYMVIHNKQVLNFMTEDAANPITDSAENVALYRRNMERYLEDGMRMDSFKKNPEPLDRQPRFSVVPFEEDGQVYVPLLETLAAFNEPVAIVDSAPPFTDVTKEDDFYADIDYIYQRHLVQGVGGGRFAPEERVTWAMLAQMLYNMEGKPAVSSGAVSGLDPDMWYYRAIRWTYDTGLCPIKAEDSLDADDVLTGAQIADILNAYAQANGYSSFSGACTEITSVSSVTRAEIASLFMQLYQAKER